MYPDILFYENTESIPVMECNVLPENVKQIDNEAGFINQVEQCCTRTNEMGIRLPDSSKAYPVFILSKELQGQNTSYYYRVNYVSLSENSLAQASKYIADKVLFASKA